MLTMRNFLAEVDRALDNLVKSGKMFGMPGGRRESFPYPKPTRSYPGFVSLAWNWLGDQEEPNH